MPRFCVRNIRIIGVAKILNHMIGVLDEFISGFFEMRCDSH